MKLKNPDKLFPLFVTDKLEETKHFYTRKLGFRASFDVPAYLQVASGDGAGAPELCFMRPDAFPDGAERPIFAGQGVIVSIPTADADATYARLREAGVELEQPPSDKPWGWRSFFARDPNGVLLDFFHVYKEVSGM